MAHLGHCKKNTDMKRTIFIIALIFSLSALPAAAQFNWNNVLGLLGGVSGGQQNGQQNSQSGVGALIGGILEGVFSKSNIEVSDMAGVWTVDGSAITFKSENFLQKAGGIAAAAAIRQKLDPYYQKYGLTGAVFSIQPNGSCTLKIKNITLNGSFQKGQDGLFLFNITLLGRTLSSIPTYVQKTATSMDIMFDANKLKDILSLVARISGSKLASTASGLLNQYDGICVGFAMQKSGNVAGDNKSVTPSDSNNNRGTSSSATNSVNTLINLFKPKK